MDALNALGLAYGSEDDEEDEEEPQDPPPRQQQQQQQQHATLPAVSLPPLAAKAGLPDAAALGLPDKDDWEAHSEEEDEAPAHDRVGTTYNAVAVPKSIASATEEHNYKATKAPHSRTNAGAAVKEALASVAAVAGSSSSGSKGESGSAPTAAGSGASVSNPKARISGGMLLPPQLSGRRNVTTEELSSMRTAKRHKH